MAPIRLGLCAAPCINKIEPGFYEEIEKKIDSLFKGKINDFKKEPLYANKFDGIIFANRIIKSC